MMVKRYNARSPNASIQYEKFENILNLSEKREKFA